MRTIWENRIREKPFKINRSRTGSNRNAERATVVKFLLGARLSRVKCKGKKIRLTPKVKVQNVSLAINSLLFLRRCLAIRFQPMKMENTARREST